jgi:NitT/TauT family transport system substrate-binding protein
METVRVIEAFHNLFYTPFFITDSLGLFREQGIEIQSRPRAMGERVSQTLGEGQADLTLTGIMRSLLDADAGRTDHVVHFAEVNSRDGFILLSRERIDAFKWRDVIGKTVITYAEPPTPWMCLLYVLKKEGIPAGQVTLSTDRQIPDAMDAFAHGFGDFLQVPEQLAENMVRAEHAHVATAMGAHVGPLPYSSFAATREFLRDRADTAMRFTRAVYAGQRWIAEHSAREIAEEASKLLTEDPAEVLLPGVERYLAQDTWAKDPLIRREGYQHLHDILRDGGLIKGNFPYEDQITTTFADAVMAER